MYCMAIWGHGIWTWFSVTLQILLSIFAAIGNEICYYDYYGGRYCYSSSNGWLIGVTVPVIIFNVLSFAFTCKIRKHEMITREHSDFTLTPCKRRASMAFIILE